MASPSTKRAGNGTSANLRVIGCSYTAYFMTGVSLFSDASPTIASCRKSVGRRLSYGRAQASKFVKTQVYVTRHMQLVLTASACTVAYTCVAAFLSSAADSDRQSSPTHNQKAQLSAFNARRETTRRSSADSTPDVPTRCPACRSSSITTTAKSPDTSSYWRCTSCGEIWNVSRRDGARPGAVPWR